MRYEYECTSPDCGKVTTVYRPSAERALPFKCEHCSAEAKYVEIPSSQQNMKDQIFGPSFYRADGSTVPAGTRKLWRK